MRGACLARRPLVLGALAVACTGLLSSCGGAGATSGSTPALVAPGAWVVMGSSSAAGAGATPGEGWAGSLQRSVAGRSVDIVNLAQGGTTTYAGLAASSAPVPNRPPADPAANIDAALAQAPKLLLVSYPSNDTALGYSAEETVHNLLAIRAAALAQGVAVVVLSTQPRALPQAQRALLPQIDAALSQAVSPCFVAVREALAAPDGTIDARYDSGDGVHLNDAGHAVIHDSLRNLIDTQRCVRAGPP